MNFTIKTAKSVEGFLPGSIPILLPHKKDNKPRLSSEKRALAQRKEEVIYCFNKVVTGPQSTALLKKDPRHRFFFQGFCINFQNFATQPIFKTKMLEQGMKSFHS